MLEKLSNALKKATDKIANAVLLDKNAVESIVKELQRALIEADVNVKLVLQLSEKLRKIAYDERIKGVEKREHLVKALHDELLSLLGTKKELVLGKKNIILLIGLYGSGKTTTAGKLAAYYSKRGKKVCAIGLDVHRPAAAEQLKQNFDKLKLPCFIAPEEKNPKKIWQKFEDELKDKEIIIVDSAGRDALDKELITEIETISKTTKPTEIILVIPADIGQTAQKQAQTFKQSLDITGVIITRFDSTARGGGALTACAEAKAPVIFIGTGEKPQDLELFNPETFLSRLLGMGDLQALIEKVHSAIDPKQAEEAQKRLREGKLSLKDVQQQLESLESIGSFDKILSLIPGMSNAKIPKEQLEVQQEKAKHWKHAINSMTKEEVENPELLEKQTSRLQRIAKGSGTSTSEIRALLKQYKLLNEMVKSQSSLGDGALDQKSMMKMMKKFGSKLGKLR